MVSTFVAQNGAAVEVDIRKSEIESLSSKGLLPRI
jgi:hypothetical protein